MITNGFLSLDFLMKIFIFSTDALLGPCSSHPYMKLVCAKFVDGLSQGTEQFPEALNHLSICPVVLVQSDEYTLGLIVTNAR